MNIDFDEYKRKSTKDLKGILLNKDDYREDVIELVTALLKERGQEKSIKILEEKREENIQVQEAESSKQKSGKLQLFLGGFLLIIGLVKMYSCFLFSISPSYLEFPLGFFLALIGIQTLFSWREGYSVVLFISLVYSFGSSVVSDKGATGWHWLEKKFSFASIFVGLLLLILWRVPKSQRRAKYAILAVLLIFLIIVSQLDLFRFGFRNLRQEYLFSAIIRNDPKLVATALKNGGEPNSDFLNGQKNLSPLVFAFSASYSVEIFKLLVEGGGDPEFRLFKDEMPKLFILEDEEKILSCLSGCLRKEKTL